MPKYGEPSSAPPQDPASTEAPDRGDGVVTAPLAEGDTTPTFACGADDSFDETPTVSDRAKPAPDRPVTAPTPGIGIYRVVRPNTSDTITPFPVPKSTRRRSRLMIAVARK